MTGPNQQLRPGASPSTESLVRPPSLVKSARTTRAQWTVIVLLFLSACLNYIDRGSLSIAAPQLVAELGLSPVQLGTLFSVFFWSYAACMIAAGWLTDRFPVGRVLAVGFALWSLATLLTGFVHTMPMLIGLRLMLGAGESVAFPAYSKIIASNFSSGRRGLPNALLDAGTKLGPAIGTMAGALIAATYGWRMLFIVLGCASLAWLVPWLIWGPRKHSGSEPVVPTTSEISHSLDDVMPSVLDILKCRDAWGTMIGNFSYMYGYYFLLTWLPTYLVQQRHVSISMMGVLASLPYWGSATSAVFCGWLSDYLIRRGHSATRVRKAFVIGGLLLSTVMLPAAIVSDLSSCIILLSIAYVAFGMFASNLWAITQTVAGPLAAGKWTGIQNTSNSLSGVIAPLLTGLIITATGSFYWAFALPAVLAVIGATSYIVVLGKVEPIDWAKRLQHKNRNSA
jgi:ACS family D-galactonate transporter-like MFS transporter